MARRARQASLALESAPRAIASASDGASHHGASTIARDVAAWRPTRRSADADILRDLPELVGRSRDLDRNSGYAASGSRTVLDNVLGSGLRLIPRPDFVALGKTRDWADEWARKTRALWDSYYWTTACHAADTLTGDQLTALTLRAAMGNGEAIGLPLWIPDRDDWSTKMQTVESDRLSNPAGETERLAFHGGIEFDAYGAPIAYHFRTTHPGDAMLAFGDGFGRWERIPRKTPFGRLRVLHVFDSERSGQSRGKPLLAAVLPKFKNLDRYEQAELQAALVNSLIAAFVTTPVTPEEVSDWFAKDRDSYLKARDEHAVKLDSGTIATLFPGDRIDAFLPARPATAFDSFMVAGLRGIALAWDLPYELLVKDWSRLNYVTARAALAEAWRSFMRRRDWLTTTWMDPWYALWLEEAVNAGKIEAPGFYSSRAAWTRCRWIGPGRATLDPTKEVTAAADRIRANLSTLEDECAELGRDWREVLEQRASERKYAAALGLPDDVAAIAPRAPAKAAPQPREPGAGAGDGADGATDGADPNGGDAEQVA